MSHKPIEGPIAHTPEWERAHYTAGDDACITSSQGAAAAGASRYAQPYDVYLTHHGQREDIAASELRVRLGNWLEPAIIDEYRRAKAAQVETPRRLYRHPDTPWIGSTPDGYCAQENAGIEAKATSTYNLKACDEWPEGLPVEWEIQCQQHMYVMGWTIVHVPILIDAGSINPQFEIYEVARDDAVIKSLLDAETELWQRIVKRDPPGIDFSHAAAQDLVRRVNAKRSKGKRIALPDWAVEAWGEHRELVSARKDAEKRDGLCKATVEYALGDAQFGELTDGRAVKVIESTRTTISMSKLPKALKEQVMPYTTTSKSVRLDEVGG